MLLQTFQIIAGNKPDEDDGAYEIKVEQEWKGEEKQEAECNCGGAQPIRHEKSGPRQQNGRNDTSLEDMFIALVDADAVAA